MMVNTNLEMAKYRLMVVDDGSIPKTVLVIVIQPLPVWTITAAVSRKIMGIVIFG